MKRCKYVEWVGQVHHNMGPAAEMFQGDEIADDQLRRRRVCRRRVFTGI